MKNPIAGINDEWENLSADHERLTNEIHALLDGYLNDTGNGLDKSSFLITGVYGAGKTSLMVHIFKECLVRGLLPIYVLAEDIFKDVTGTQGDLKRKANEFVSSFVEKFDASDFDGMKMVISAGDKDLKTDLVTILNQNRNNICVQRKIILLVDELEDEYKSIKNRIESDPLRVWLEDRTFLKFLSLTPSGVYDLGGADEGRLTKLNIPAVSIRYLRDKKGLHAGRANALWWLSRGIPRNIVKGFSKIGSITEIPDEYELSRILTEELDRIGKPPGQVSAVELPSDHSKIKDLINIQPQQAQAFKGFRIGQQLSEGELSKVFQGSFNLQDADEKRRLALLIAHYFKLVSLTISDENYNSYLRYEELNEFLMLVLDILLEHEFKSPVVEETMSELFRIYEDVKDSNILLPAFLTGQIKEITYHTDLDKELPFKIEEIRKLFLPYMANPVIKSDPDEVLRQVSGKGKPVCKLTDNTIFFATYKDFEEYVETDDFKSKALVDGKHVIILLPAEEFVHYDKSSKSPSSKTHYLIKWLAENNKLGVIIIPSVLKLFLLSLYGYENKIPFDISVVTHQITESKEFFAQRKFELHYSAVQRLIEDVKLIPACYFLNRNEPNGMKDVWGISKISEDSSDSVIAGLAQSFFRVSLSNINKLIPLRELFKTEGSKGKLAEIGLRRGLPTLADRFLPRKDISGNIGDAPLVESLRDFWNNDEREKLQTLALLLTLEDFEKLHADANYKRILRAFWRAERNDFRVEDMADLKRRSAELVNKIEQISKIEQTALKEFGLTIIFDNRDEILAKSKDGLLALSGLSFDELLPNYIFSLYLKGVLDETETRVNNVLKDMSEISKHLVNLRSRAKNLLAKFKEDKEVLELIKNKISYDDIEREIKLTTQIDNEIDFSEVVNELRNRINQLNTILVDLGELMAALNGLKQKLASNNLLEALK